MWISIIILLSHHLKFPGENISDFKLHYINNTNPFANHIATMAPIFKLVTLLSCKLSLTINISNSN